VSKIDPENINKSEIASKYPLMHHLTELRKRLIYILITVLIVFIATYSQGKLLMEILTGPILEYLPEGSTISFLKITEGFLTELKLAALAAIFFAMPLILYQLWKFIAPGLYVNEKKYLVSFVVSASLLFFTGAAFAYFIVFPFGFQFFLKYASSDWNMVANLSVDWYLTFVVKLIMAFGIVFELPVIIFFLSIMGIVNDTKLKKYRRYAVVTIFILAAVLTPPDVISQITMAIPLLILYEISIIISKFASKKDTSEETKNIYD